MRLQSAVLAATLVLALAACGDDEVTRPTTPVTLKFRPLVYSQMSGTANDTVKGFVIVDGTTTVSLPYDSIIDLPRGEHTFEAHLNIDYLPSTWTEDINPSGNTALVTVGPAGTCRVYRAGSQIIDGAFCDPDGPGGPIQKNSLEWSQYPRIYCPAGDFIEFCNPAPAGDGFGMTWPVNQASGITNEYLSQAKLLVAGTVGPELTLPAGERNIAMALYRVGDYSPRRRLEVVPGDSSRYTNIAWTDVRHVPVYNFPTGQLPVDERINGLFGLEVKATYFLSQQFQDALIVRYDVRNISNQLDYRRVHPQIGPNGFTLQNVYLTPVIDTDIGGGFSGEADDDAATVFPAEGLAVAYDRTFAVAPWQAPWNTAPGMVGLKILNTTAGTPKGVIFDTDDLDYFERGEEIVAHAIISAGRGTPLAGCTDYPSAFICGGGTGGDMRLGYSVGPIASIAPGEKHTITVAILLASPAAGQFTSGTVVNPQNATQAELESTAKPIYQIASALRTLAANIASIVVTEGP